MSMGFFAAGAGGGSAPTATLYDLIMAQPSLAFYFRHAEPSGSVMENETGGTDGTYIATTTLAQTALYTGGPTSVLFTGTSSGGQIPTTLLPDGSASALTLMTIMLGANSGTRQIISRDADSGDRRWQWRINNTNFQFIKTTGSVETVARAHGLSVDVAAIVGVTVTSGGVVSLFTNGARIGATQTIASANYGSDSRDIYVNRRAATDGSSRRFSESACFTTALSDAEMLAFAQAAGFA